MNTVDIVSDLHIEHWDTKLKYSKKSNDDYVLNSPFKCTPFSDILVVAGDVADNIDDCIDYLNTLSKHYKHVLFVDGNHEHNESYPMLLSDDEIDTKFKENKNKKLVFLTKNPFLYKGHLFLGCNGWWDFNESQFFMKKSMKTYGDYFNLSVDESRNLIKSIYKTGKDQIKQLESYVKKSQKDPSIKSINIVTHSVPLKKYTSYNYPCEMNTHYSKLFKYKKIRHWIFGHTHSTFHDFDYSDESNIKYICNPRGRPNWAMRVNYNPFSALL